MAVLPWSSVAAGTLRGGGAAARLAEFQAAMEEVLSCGGEAGQAHAAEIEADLGSMWSRLPKNDMGRVEWKSLRYVVHRYFVERYDILVRGIEPQRHTNTSHADATQLLHVAGAANLANALAATGTQNGFTMKDAVAMIATLEQLISDTEDRFLKLAYQETDRDTSELLNMEEVMAVMDAYITFSLLDNGHFVETKKTWELRNKIPFFHDAHLLVKGLLRELQFERSRSPTTGQGNLVVNELFSFDDLREGARRMTRSFGRFWNSQCMRIKEGLLDQRSVQSTGRIDLARFHEKNSFYQETEEYLRELGALDESSRARGKQVIIANYLQGASNCVVDSTHYLICCKAECLPILNEIEDAAGGPMARPELILKLVSNMTTGLDDKPVNLDASLRGHLQRIADTHGGEIPLHGRLFAQWMHYVMPLECPYPQRAGSTAMTSVREYSAKGKALVSSDSKAKSEATSSDEKVNAEAWLSQWSDEEDVLHTASTKPRMRGKRLVAHGAALAFAGFLAWAKMYAGEKRSCAAGGGGLLISHVGHSHVL